MKQFVYAILLAFIPIGLFAGEGMWLPQLLKKLNEAEMQSLGMKMSAEDIYSVNRGSLKDAIIHFGGFCTGEVISSKGLILTNHHCGYGAIQSHSSVEKNYLKNGFWANQHSDELPNPGLFATFIVRIEDVTDKALKGIDATMSAEERQSTLDKNLEEIRNTTTRESYQDIVIRPFFKGNQYFLFVSETYNDVRLVGTPPENIGKFGSDTDNWIWPRHTGDFAMFRIYASKNNMPADYSPDNQPLKPRHHLPISIDGVEENDFTLVFGFPGRTDQYLPAVAVQQIVEHRNPARIAVREQALKILDSYMRKDEATRLKYASKYASIANYWKKWIGESQGIRKTKGIQKKLVFEDEFTQELKKKKTWKKDYAKLLPDLNELYNSINKHQVANDLFSEVYGRNIEITRIASLVNRLAQQYEAQGENGYMAFKARLDGFLENFYKDYDPSIDKQIFIVLTDFYLKNIDPGFVSQVTRDKATDIHSLANDIYIKSHLTSHDKISTLLDMDPKEAVQIIQTDPALLWYKQIQNDHNILVEPERNKALQSINALEQEYMKAILDVFHEQTFYPDANSTMRVTYGQVKGYQPRDAVSYEHITYLDGVIEKYVPGDYEFDVSSRLLELYKNKDYGDYSENGKMPVCFIGSNHTTGGNSGSPAIDAHGNLIGLNFDRVWEGTMSDYHYDPSICRNIMVDVRYILFIVDKYAGAKHIIDELDLVRPKRG